MLDKILFNRPSWSEGRQALDAGTLRQRTVAQNLAQAATPGYEAQRVSFEERLADAEQAMPMARTRAGHLGAPGPQPIAPQVEAQNGVVGSNGNDVDVERELIELQENALHFRALSQFVAGRYRAVLTAIQSQR